MEDKDVSLSSMLSCCYYIVVAKQQSNQMKYNTYGTDQRSEPMSCDKTVKVTSGWRLAWSSRCIIPVPLFCPDWTFSNSYHLALKSAGCCRWGMVSRRCGGPRVQSDIATLLFCPAALCPLRLPRTAANVCLLAISSSCKLETSPEGEAERGTEQKEKGRWGGRKSRGGESDTSDGGRATICCYDFIGA